MLENKCTMDIPCPQTKPHKPSKINTVYEDDSWIIDVIDGVIRISYFRDNHFVDEMIIGEKNFEDYVEKENTKDVSGVRCVSESDHEWELTRKSNLVGYQVFECKKCHEKRVM